MSERVHPITYIGSMIASAAAVAFLVWLLYFKGTAATEQSWAHYLPYCNALFNACAAYHLMRGWAAIRRREQSRHRAHMLQALLFSTLFLISYIVYHSVHGDTRFPDLGWIRWLYWAILGSHVLLSILILPVILVTFALALSGKFNVHPRWGRVALPVWLYVSVTGVLIVAFLKGFAGS